MACGTNPADDAALRRLAQAERLSPIPHDTAYQPVLDALSVYHRSRVEMQAAHRRVQTLNAEYSAKLYEAAEVSNAAWRANQTARAALDDAIDTYEYGD